MAWTTPRTWIVGETVTAGIMNTHVRDNLNALLSPLDYVERTTNLSVTATSAATAQTFITSSTLTFDGSSSYLAEVYSPGVTYDGNQANLSLWENATNKGLIWTARAPGDTRTEYDTIRADRRWVPAAGTYTISVRAWVGFGTGYNLGGGAGGAGVVMPAYLRIRRS